MSQDTIPLPAERDRQWASEISYCIALLHSRGNPSVPRDVIYSYFECQAAGALRAGRDHIGRCFARAAAAAFRLDWAGASIALRDA